jgi:hypothetical protein
MPTAKPNAKPALAVHPGERPRAGLKGQAASKERLVDRLGQRLMPGERRAALQRRRGGRTM